MLILSLLVKLGEHVIMRGGTGPLCGAFFAPKPFFLSLFEHGKKGEQIKNRYIFHIKACIPCVSLRAATHALIDHRLPANPEIITENVFSPPPHPTQTHERDQPWTRGLPSAFNRSAALTQLSGSSSVTCRNGALRGAGTDVACEWFLSAAKACRSLCLQ